MEKKYTIPDPETGMRYPVTKEQYDAYVKAWDYFRPKMEGFTGRIIVFGTAGSMDENESLSTLFHRSENYDIKDSD